MTTNRNGVVRLLKVSEGKDTNLSSMDILSLHLGTLQQLGKVTFSTDIAVNDTPEFVVLVEGNDGSRGILCHVDDIEYFGTEPSIPASGDYVKYSPEKYKGDPQKTWMIFDSMVEVPSRFVTSVIAYAEEELKCGSLDPLKRDLFKYFATNRANSKTLPSY